MQGETLSRFNLGNLRLWRNEEIISNDLRFPKADTCVNAHTLLIPIATFPISQLKLFSPLAVFDLDVRNGEAVKLYNANCE